MKIGRTTKLILILIAAAVPVIAFLTFIIGFFMCNGICEDVNSFAYVIVAIYYVTPAYVIGSTVLLVFSFFTKRK
jgi:hypothetical protein